VQGTRPGRPPAGSGVCAVLTVAAVASPGHSLAPAPAPAPPSPAAWPGAVTVRSRPSPLTPQPAACRTWQWQRHCPWPG